MKTKQGKVCIVFGRFLSKTTVFLRLSVWKHWDGDSKDFSSDIYDVDFPISAISKSQKKTGEWILVYLGDGVIDNSKMPAPNGRHYNTRLRRRQAELFWFQDISF